MLTGTLAIHCLPLFDLALILEISPALSFEACFFVYPLWLLIWVCFSILDKSAMTPSLCGMALCNRSPVESTGAVFLITLAECSRNLLHSRLFTPSFKSKNWIKSPLNQGVIYIIDHLVQPSIFIVDNIEEQFIPFKWILHLLCQVLFTSTFKGSITQLCIATYPTLLHSL